LQHRSLPSRPRLLFSACSGSFFPRARCARWMPTKSCFPPRSKRLLFPPHSSIPRMPLRHDDDRVACRAKRKLPRSHTPAHDPCAIVARALVARTLLLRVRSDHVAPKRSRACEGGRVCGGAHANVSARESVHTPFRVDRGLVARTLGGSPSTIDSREF